MLDTIRQEAMSVLRKVRDSRITKTTTSSTKRRRGLTTEVSERNGMEKALKENENGVSDRGSMEVESQQGKPMSSI